MTNVFTACPNGKYEDHSPHDFVGYSPGERDPVQYPVMFCSRCGETRYLQVAPREESPAPSEKVAVKARKKK